MNVRSIIALPIMCAFGCLGYLLAHLARATAVVSEDISFAATRLLEWAER